MSVVEGDERRSDLPADPAQQDEAYYDRFFLNHQQPVKTQAGTYLNQRFVGRGGNGTTFLATAIEGPYVGLQFALKVFHKISNDRRRTAFLGEIEYYKTLDHPAITRFYDEGEYKVRDRIYPFVVVEYVPNSLQRIIIESSHRLDKTSAMRYILNVTSALMYLHERDVPLVHRDIKPGNILISGEKAKLADFGLVKSLEEAVADEPEATRDELVYAAMPRFYRSPELVRRAKGDKSPLTPASDIYQLGSVLYEVITGYNPQGRPNELTDDIKLNLKRVRGSCGDKIFDLVKAMLTDAPSERPDARAVLGALLDIHSAYCEKLRETTGEFI
jgi:serine/threonine-protein kinase